MGTRVGDVDGSSIGLGYMVFNPLTLTVVICEQL